jgi:5-methyltetrahydropteroyltriglutamate--homocysteine methyltransferase
MQRSTDRILTTHVGSLPRPPDLLEMLLEGRRGPTFEATARRAVVDVVEQQAAIGLDIVNDGEIAKTDFSTYVTERLAGFESSIEVRAPSVESALFPDFYASALGPEQVRGPINVKACVGPIEWRGTEQVERDMANLTAALAHVSVEDVFVTAASPGLAWFHQPNRYYQTQEEYVFAVADAMKHEYDAIHRSGFLVQLDAPDLAGGWNRPEFADKTSDDFRSHVRLHVDALNHATRDIPPERMRLHACWGNFEGPHVRDIPLSKIIDILLGARPAALSVEGANPRHGHEWQVFSEVAWPDGKILVAGVLDSTTNFVEHPELVAQRLERYVGLLGRDNVIAGADCGFATLGRSSRIHPTIAWAKLEALVAGGRIASRRLWA